MKESGRDGPATTFTTTITAIVVDDEPLGLQELAFLLRAHQDIQIVAEARNGIEAFQLIKEHEPDVIFLDVAMPGAVVRQEKRTHRHPRPGSRL